MESRKLIYSFNLPGEQKEEFVLEYDSKTLELVSSAEQDLPSWTFLDYNKCPHCPLKSEDSPRCPLAVSIAGVVRQFQNIISYNEIYLTVESDERVVTQKTTAQRALGSFMGVVMAISGCPRTAFFRPMARFHLPLASEEETVYRSTAMYLLAQYFCKSDGKDTDYSLDGLNKIYKSMEIVNTSVVNRLRAASRADSSVNAVIMLDMYAKLVPYGIDDSLEDIRYLFSAYLDGNNCT